MPRYFFNVHGTRYVVDDVGEELPDAYAAWSEATIIAGELFKFQPGQEGTLEVTDAQRRSLFFIDISARNVN
jgi:hypothetical protein